MTNLARKLAREKAKLNRLIGELGLGDPEVQKQSKKVDKLLNDFERGVRNRYKVVERGKVLSLSIA